MAAEVAGYCGRCGAPFAPGAGAFCGRCGNPIAAQPPPVLDTQYPVVAAASVPGAHQKLSHSRLLLVAGGAAAAVVVVITLVVVLARPGSTPCGFYCGPQHGPRLAAATEYTNQQFGYTVDYDKSMWSIASQDANGIHLQAQVGSGLCTSGILGEIDITAVSGNDVNGALQQATNNLFAGQLQLQPGAAVNGAEVGTIVGVGTSFTGNLIPTNNTGQGAPVAAVALASTDGSVTIVATAWSQQSTDTHVAPYALCNADYFDGIISNTFFKSQQ